MYLGSVGCETRYLLHSVKVDSMNGNMTVYVMKPDQFNLFPSFFVPIEIFGSIANATNVTGCIEFTQFGPHLYEGIAIYVNCTNCVVYYSSNYTCFPGKAAIIRVGNESMFDEPMPVNTLFDINVTLHDKWEELDYVAEGNLTVVALSRELSPIGAGIFIGEHTVNVKNGVALFTNQSFNRGGEYVLSFQYLSTHGNSTLRKFADLYPVVISGATRVFGLNMLLLTLIYLIY